MFFNKRKSNEQKPLKVGDYIVVRHRPYHKDDQDKWDAVSGCIYPVLSISGEEVIYGSHQHNWKANIGDCIRILDEEVERYCEIKGSRIRVTERQNAKESKMPAAAKNIKIGDTIKTNYIPDYRGWNKNFNKYDYTVLSLTKDLVVCTRLNKNCDLLIFPRETCYTTEKGEING